MFLDGTYEIVALLGEGGFGQVFLARDLLLHERNVAIKVLKLQDTKHRDDFIREMQFLTQLAHPQIVSAGSAILLPSEKGCLNVRYIAKPLEVRGGTNGPIHLYEMPTNIQPSPPSVNTVAFIGGIVNLIC